MTVLYYNHTEGNVTIEATKEIISIEQAKELFDKGEVNDCNLAFNTLRQCDWDWDKVESYYGENITSPATQKRLDNLAKAASKFIADNT